MAPSVSGLKGDEDDDDTAINTGVAPGEDNDADGDNDRTGNLGKGYYDEDDGRVRDFGHEAAARTARALEQAAARYFAVAATDDGAALCSMIKTTIASSLAQVYGGIAGPAYTRGARTCAEVMSRVLRHRHREEPSSAMRVTGVRVGGGQALVLLGSKTQPAAYLTFERERGEWRIVGLRPDLLP